MKQASDAGVRRGLSRRCSPACQPRGHVTASALDALQKGFIPFVHKDGCGARDPRPHAANLFDMQAKMAEVIGEAQAIAVLNRTAA